MRIYCTVGNTESKPEAKLLTLEKEVLKETKIISSLFRTFFENQPTITLVPKSHHIVPNRTRARIQVESKVSLNSILIIMRRLLFLTTILASLFVLIYCNNTKQLTSQTEALFRNKWKLTEVQGQQVPDSLRSSFEFSPGNLSGSAGCNRISAGFVAGKNQTVRFSPETTTKKACANENVATLETLFLDALARSTKWDIKGSELWLGTDGGTLIKLRSL